MQRIERLLRPNSIAVIGGGSWCENVVRECRKMKFAGKIFPIHPNKHEIAGLTSFKSLAELEEVPDATFIGVNRHATVSIVVELAKSGGGAVCFASGFAEAVSTLRDGEDLQSELVSAAGDMPILGPNCYGFINAVDGVALWPDQHGLTQVENGVAIITQSSNIALNLTMQKRGLPIAYLVTAGNQAQTGLSAIGMGLLSDERVTALGLHIEGLDDLREFEKLSKFAWKLDKQVVVIKIGRSPQAKMAAKSHTASIAGNESGSTALFKRLGFAQVDSLSAFLESLKILHVGGRLKNNKIVSVSCSGGEAGLIGDSVSGRELVFPELSERQKSDLQQILGLEVTCTNPLDYHTRIWGNIGAMSSTLELMLEDDVGLGLVILDFPRKDRCDYEEWLKVIESAENAKNATDKRVAVLSTLPENMPEEIAIDLVNRGIIPLLGMEESVEAIEAIARLSNFCQCKSIYMRSVIRNQKLISEAEAKTVLDRYGISTPNRILANNKCEALAAAQNIGFPVAIKGVGIEHKTDSGAVILNVDSTQKLSDTVQSIPTDEVLVEKMVEGIVLELLIGVVRDPTCGYILTLAAGGVLTELLHDSCSLLIPTDRKDVEDALCKLRIAPMFTGYRNKPACDIKKIVDSVIAVQKIVMDNPIEEMEINPLLCGVNFAVAADALIVSGEDYA